MKKILSIIIPTYNMEKFLPKCLGSLVVIDEMMDTVEVLIINDGSKDSSSAIAHEYENQFPNTFRVIDKENGNYGSCINRGLKEVTGKYIKILDADDSFDTNIFQNYLLFLNDTETDLVINDYCIVDLDSNITEEYSFDLPKLFPLSEMSNRVIPWLWHHGIAYKSTIFQRLDYRQTEGISYTDDEWIFMPMSVVESVSYFTQNLYLYLMGREGQTFDPVQLKKSFGQRITVAKNLAHYYSSKCERCNEGQINYLESKLLSRLTPIYDFYLCKEYSKEGITKLIELDEYIKETLPKFYTKLNKATDRFGFVNIISRWQKAGYKDTLYIYLKRIYFKICILLKHPYRNLHMPNSIRRKQ